MERRSGKDSDAFDKHVLVLPDIGISFSVSQVDICDGVTACKQGKHVCVYVKIETTSGQNYTVIGRSEERRVGKEC